MIFNRIVPGITSCSLFLAAFSHSQGRPASESDYSTGERVGQIATNRYFTPANQILTPFGTQVELPGMRPQAIALSPDGKLLVTAGKTHDLVVIDPARGDILQRVPLPSNDDANPAP